MPDSRPLLLDTFCKAGGCSVGYERAGFEVVGVDIEPQPNYPFEFHQADALLILTYLARDDMRSTPVWLERPWSAVHGSPPCHASSNLRYANGIEYENLIPSTRELLKLTGLPYVIENVEGAELIDPVTICGSSLGLDVRRHRLFESNWPMMVPPCAHGWQTPRFDVFEHGEWRKATAVPVYGSGGRKAVEHWAAAMDIDWMNRAELAQAIPPAYTELIGHQLMQEVAARAA